MAGLFGSDPGGRGTKSLLDQLLEDFSAPLQPTSGAPFGLGMNALSGLGDILNRPNATPRTRSSWNARFEHWEKPASVAEGQSIDRAEMLVRRAIAGNTWMLGEGVTVAGQGSYFNNTNVRLEADIDLRVVHPVLMIDYGTDVVQQYADSILNITYVTPTLQETLSKMRSQLASDLMQTFGKQRVDASGNKAIRLSQMTGGAEVDVVPSCRYQHISWLQEQGRYNVIEGVAILSREGGWTLNFPMQHSRNGIDKRNRTQHRFKKLVRIFKRLRQDLIDHGKIKDKVPSFLVECLVYIVEDWHFLVASDDRYDRVRRVARRVRELLVDPTRNSKLLEINDVKWLFHETQPWNQSDALAYIDAVILHLGDT